MKRLLNVLILLFAVNFLAIAGAMGWLVRSGRLDRSKARAIREILFPPGATGAATQPADRPPETGPVLRVDELLAKYAGRPPAEQLDYVRKAFEVQMAQIERAHRNLIDLQRQVELAQQQLQRDRSALEQQRAEIAAEREQIQRLASDKGFQDTLALYQSMPAKQVKTIFMSLDDATVARYLQALESRAAARITREFKTAEETERLKRILERLCQTQPSASGP